MTGISTVKDRVFNTIFGRKEHVVEGIVLGDAWGNPPDLIWEPSRKGISVRTESGEMTCVSISRHTRLAPAHALGWSCGDTLCIRGKLEREGDVLIFSSALLEIGS